MKKLIGLLIVAALCVPIPGDAFQSDVTCNQEPALTGDVTTLATSCTTSLVAGSASNLNSGTLAAARGGAGTINGALKGNGSGVVSQAATSDLSDVTTPSTTCGANTPTLAFGGASVGITYSTRTCQYVKVGKHVIVELAITLTSKGSSTGAATLSGFPAAANITTGACAFYSGMSGITGSLTVNGSGTLANLYMPAATVATALIDTNFSNTSLLQCTIPYISS